MKTFTTRHLVRHSADNMFALVADVESYPDFVPLCEDLRIRGRQDLDGDRQILIADMTVGYKVFRETFTSKVTVDRPNLLITVAYLDGPFRKLENRWRFTPKGEGACDVEFYISYEFKSRTLGLVAGAAFDRAFRQFSTAFEERADAIYGKAEVG